jgi:26S proteasome regulatory subunit N12
MAELKEAATEYQALSKEWSKGPKMDKGKVASMLEKLKLMLLKLSFLPTKTEEANQKELLLSRDTLEIGAQYAVVQEDIPGFERYMAQLQTYYHDHQGFLPDSPFQYQLLGLNLLCLLSQNRVAEFHTELERLPAKEVQNNVYIKHPVSLEQYIMEGSYNKVLLAKGNVPAESYKYFIDILMITVRSEIASCLEKAYADISCSDAARMLSIGAGDVNAYATERGWQIAGGRLQFRGADAENEEQGVPSVQLANMAITYAREMEQIV